MDSREKRYIKIAKSKAKEYLRKKKGYKTKAEKKAFKIAEKYRINQWKSGLSGMDKTEAAAQMKAFRAYSFKVNFLRNLIFAAALALAVLLLLIVML